MYYYTTGASKPSCNSALCNWISIVGPSSGGGSCPPHSISKEPPPPHTHTLDATGFKNGIQLVIQNMLQVENHEFSRFLE